MKAYQHKYRRKAQMDFSGIDLGLLLDRVRKGIATYEEKFILASFSGSYLRHWQDERGLINQGIINHWSLTPTNP